MTDKVRSWLQTANGWRRLWFAAAALGTFYFVLINPFVLTSDSQLSEWKYRWAAEKEFKNPECTPYQTQPIRQLTEPAYDSEGNRGCWHIYTSRKLRDNDVIPYTLKIFNGDFIRERWIGLLELAGIGAIGALLVSALLYFIGWVVAWVIAGFRK